MGLESSKVDAAAAQHSSRMIEDTNVKQPMIMFFPFGSRSLPGQFLCFWGRYAVFLDRNLKQGPGTYRAGDSE